MTEQQRTQRRPRPAVPHRRVAIRRGCAEHRTPAGQPCQWCTDQDELFPRADAGAPTYRRTR